MAEGLFKKDLSDKESFNKKLQFLILADKMKSIYRRTLLADKSRRETDAEHSWHLALMALIFADYAPKGTDISRVVEMVLVHDLVEIFAGDTFCYDTSAGETQQQREESAAERLFSLLPKGEGDYYKELWREFDRRDTPDSRFAASLDRFQPLINNFLTDCHTWRTGSVAKEQVEERTEIIKETMPLAWETVEEIIKYAEEREYFTS